MSALYIISIIFIKLDRAKMKDAIYRKCQFVISITAISLFSSSIRKNLVLCACLLFSKVPANKLLLRDWHREVL